jgi:carbon storage regulator
METPMLVLTRRLNETIVIDGGIEVTVVAVDRNKVRLGIVAPASVRVDRAEVRERRGEFEAAMLRADEPVHA